MSEAELAGRTRGQLRAMLGPAKQLAYELRAAVDQADKLTARLEQIIDGLPESNPTTTDRAPEVAPEIWIALEGPDMTYYGSATILAVAATEADAVAAARRQRPNWTGKDFEPITIERWQIGESADTPGCADA